MAAVMSEAMSVPTLAGSLQADCVGLRLGGKTVLQPCSLTIPAGQVTAILGPNGAGKSSLLSLLSGQRALQSGTVRINGTALNERSPAEWALRRALLPQDTATAFDFSVRDVVELGRFPHRRQPSVDEIRIIDDALRLTDVYALQHRVLNSLSGGEKARAQLARVLAQIWLPRADGQPRWLLLDEPTAALDFSHQHGVLQAVRSWAVEQGVGVVAVLHDVNLALRYCDQALVLHQGAIVCQGRARDVLTPQRLADVWGVHAEPVLAQDGVGQLLITA